MWKSDRYRSQEENKRDQLMIRTIDGETRVNVSRHANYYGGDTSRRETRIISTGSEYRRYLCKLMSIIMERGDDFVWWCGSDAIKSIQSDGVSNQKGRVKGKYNRMDGNSLNPFLLSFSR